jgi:protein-S-isoprenylcysteine O-methyltransferase Ste14
LAQALGGIATARGGLFGFSDLFSHVVHVEVFDRIDDLIEGWAGKGAGLGEDENAVAESHQRGDGSNVCGSGQVSLSFSVHLPEGNLGVLVARFFVNGRKRFTRTTPVGPEVNEGDSLFGYAGFEVCFGQVNGRHGCPFVARNYTPWGIPRGGVVVTWWSRYAEGVNKRWAWGLVVGQFALIIALILVPAGSLWDRSVFVWVLASALFVVAGVVGILAGTRLGANLTPNPIPKPDGTLETGGLYRYVRHPIYTAVLALALGLTTLAASLPHLVIFLILVMLLGTKARAEERLLRERFPDYRDYQARVGRFLPGIGRIR